MKGSAETNSQHTSRNRWQAMVAGLAIMTTACGADGTAVARQNTPEFVGGCAPSIVYAQNRWKPYGAAERAAPSTHAKQIGGAVGNTAISIDGWVDPGLPVYPSNTPPWNSTVWFHVAKAGQEAWVSFAGVRANKTENDPTGYDTSGQLPVATTPDCQGVYQP